MATCIRCWWCTCNGSCSCTPQEIREYKIAHGYKVDTNIDSIAPEPLGKEIRDLDPKDYLWLTQEDAIKLFFKQTGKVAISQNELRKLLTFTKPIDDSNNSNEINGEQEPNEWEKNS